MFSLACLFEESLKVWCNKPLEISKNSIYFFVLRPLFLTWSGYWDNIVPGKLL